MVSMKTTAASHEGSERNGRFNVSTRTKRAIGAVTAVAVAVAGSAAGLALSRGNGQSEHHSKQRAALERVLTSAELEKTYASFRTLGKSATGHVELALGIKGHKETGTLFTSTDGGRDWSTVVGVQNASSATWAPKGDVFAAMYGLGKPHDGPIGGSEQPGTAIGAPSEVGLFEVGHNGQTRELASSVSDLTELGSLGLPGKYSDMKNYDWAIKDGSDGATAYTLDTFQPVGWQGSNGKTEFGAMLDTEVVATTPRTVA
jgi:hypothetical protein